MANFDFRLVGGETYKPSTYKDFRDLDEPFKRELDILSGEARTRAVSMYEIFKLMGLAHGDNDPRCVEAKYWGYGPNGKELHLLTEEEKKQTKC